jgi:hypothetical protein
VVLLDNATVSSPYQKKGSCFFAQESIKEKLLVLELLKSSTFDTTKSFKVLHLFQPNDDITQYSPFPKQKFPFWLS